MKLREKKNLKSLKEPTFDDDEYEDEEMASEQDDASYSDKKEAISPSSESDDPEADYKAFKLYRVSPPESGAKSNSKKSNSKSKPRRVTKKSTVSGANLLKSEYFNDMNDETSQDQPPIKARKTMAKSSSSGKLLENQVHEVLSKIEETTKQAKNGKSTRSTKSTKPRAKKQVRIITIALFLT